MTDHKDFPWVQVAARVDARWASIVVVVAVVAAVVGYVVGTSRSGVSIHTGTAHSVEAQISIVGSDGWVYGVPLDVNWTDTTGGWHEGSRPDCLPPTGATLSPITFAATEVTVRGITWRPVVWVSCGG
jgi:hypothetical protein